jgi:hypothetical protein
MLIRIYPKAMFAAIAAAAALAACAGWEGPSNWLDESHVVGRRASACAAARDTAQAEYPSEVEFSTSHAGWRGSVRAQDAECITHTPPFDFAQAAWVECRVEGPALIMHSPPIAGEETFIAGSGRFSLRATRRGLSCRPLRTD